MYCTVDQVRQLARALENENDTADLEEDILSHIQKASARVDAYLSRRYAVPLPLPAPPIVASIAADMAAAFLLDQAVIVRRTEEIPYSKTLYSRAMQDIERILTEGLLDGCPGVRLRDAVLPGSRYIAASTRGPSPLQEVLEQW